NRLNKCQGTIGFHLHSASRECRHKEQFRSAESLCVVAGHSASGIREPPQLVSGGSESIMIDLAFAAGPKSEMLTGPSGNEVAPKCVPGASRSSAFDAPLSPSVPAGPQRCSEWHAGTWRALTILTKFSGAALDRSRNDRAGVCTAGR